MIVRNLIYVMIGVGFALSPRYQNLNEMQRVGILIAWPAFATMETLSFLPSRQPPRERE